MKHTFQINDAFWSPIREIIRRESIPYQWKALNDLIPNISPSYCMRNFRAAAGKIKADHGGCVFQDSDVAKWLEGVAYSLTWHKDEELEEIADNAINEIIAAQQEDGYLDTYYILNGLDKRWTNMMDHHEMYCAGHMIEAAVAYYQATGKRKLLDAMLKLVAHIDSIVGPEEGKLPGYPGHPVLEMALMRLYEITGDPNHFRLAEYFVRERGRDPQYFEQEIMRNNLHCHWSNGPLGMAYYQAHKPLVDQEDAVGHAVRALYLYAGLADVARETADQALLTTCNRMWNSVTRKRMYITGAVGSSEYGEAFTFDYDLPNDTIYGETCASIALVFFAHRMLKLQVRSEYADVMERALYNGVISGMQLDGKKFFYVNPLEVVPEACEKDMHKRHVRPERQTWFGCACCPPNIIRLMMSLQQYIYSVKGNTIYTHLYISGNTETEVNGKPVKLQLHTNYPWNGEVKIKVDATDEMVLALRIPGWCDDYAIMVNGKRADCVVQDGYACINRHWNTGDEVELCFSMQVKLYSANPLVREDIGQVAVMRGPLVYCLEEADNGRFLHLVRMGTTSTASFEVMHMTDSFGDVVTLRSQGLRENNTWKSDVLYDSVHDTEVDEVMLRWIPYYCWANRGLGEMRVWIRK